MISWKKYLSTVVETFRVHYDRMTDKEKAAAQLNMTLNKPCQIELLSFKDDGQIMFVALYPNLPDEIIVHKNLGKDFDYSSVLDDRLPELNVKEILTEYVREGKPRLDVPWQSLTNSASVYVFQDLQKAYPDPKSFARDRFVQVYNLLQDNLRTRARGDKIGNIEAEFEEIKERIEKIGDERLKAEMLPHFTMIDSSILDVKKLDQHEQKLKTIEREIGGVRKLIGTKTFGEWKVLLSEIDKVNARVDALYDIKDAYDKVLAQQAEVMKQQSSFVKWIKYVTIIVPIAVICVPIIEILLRHFLSVS